MLALKTYIPQKLHGLIKSFWCLKVSGLVNEVYKEDIIPDGHHEIIFHHNPDNAKRTTHGNTTWVNEPESFFAGQTLHSYSLELKKKALLYGIRFCPHTLHHLFNFPADSITDSLLPVNDIKKAQLFKDCITENAEETFTRLEAVLIKLCYHIDLSSARFKYVDYAVTEIIKTRGSARIDTLIAKTGISAKHFDTIFKQSVGINPKPFCNIIKLNHFINYKNLYPKKTLTECSYEADFFDQSHLIKVFKAVTGISPKAFFNNDNYINSAFSGL